MGRVFALTCALLFVAIPAVCVAAQADKPAAASDKNAADKSQPSDKTPAADKNALPPLPAEAHTQQSIQLDGKTLKYTVTVGSLPTRDKDGKVAGDVVVTAYTMDGENRPVTFRGEWRTGRFERLSQLWGYRAEASEHGNEGDSPSDPPVLKDNPGTWLDFTDLVFIDPVGTGFSRASVPEDQAKKLFYSTGPDIEYLSRIIYDWLVKNNRLGSRKYLVGESYGGFRGPRITYYLQSQLGVAMNGVVLVSPYLNPTIENNGDLSPIPWLMTLPPITAAHLERENKLTPQAMADVIAYTEGEYATTLLKGRADEDATKKMIARVTEMTGLDPEFVKFSGGRLDTEAYLARGASRTGKARFNLRLECDFIRSVSVCAGAAGKRSDSGQHYCADDDGDG